MDKIHRLKKVVEFDKGSIINLTVDCIHPTLGNADVFGYNIGYTLPNPVWERDKLLSKIEILFKKLVHFNAPHH